MTDTDVAALQRELNSFHAEQEKVRALIGQIGGKGGKKRDLIVNVAFIALIAGLFLFDLVLHIFFKNVDFLPPVVTLELGILLVSIKIVWMIHKQTRVEHFQFWILNSIEFRLNAVSQQLREVSQTLQATVEQPPR